MTMTQYHEGQEVEVYRATGTGYEMSEAAAKVQLQDGHQMQLRRASREMGDAVISAGAGAIAEAIAGTASRSAS